MKKITKVIPVPELSEDILPECIKASIISRDQGGNLIIELESAMNLCGLEIYPKCYYKVFINGDEYYFWFVCIESINLDGEINCSLEVSVRVDDNVICFVDDTYDTFSKVSDVKDIIPCNEREIEMLNGIKELSSPLSDDLCGKDFYNINLDEIKLNEREV